MRAKRAAARATAVTVAMLAITGCGTVLHSAAPPPAKVHAALSGAPSPLARLHAQADQLLGGGPSAFTARLHALLGYPIVVDKWASWCVACQSEFPQFQRVSLQFGKQVAFIGLDGKDANPAAAAFLRQFPVSYPSYTDPTEQIARAIRAATYYPQTLFYNRQGKLVYDHVGEFPSTASLVSAVRRYALG